MDTAVSLLVFRLFIEVVTTLGKAFLKLFLKRYHELKAYFNYASPLNKMLKCSFLNNSTRANNLNTISL